jgi:hypothetical protein
MPRRICTPVIRKDRPAICSSTSTRAYKRLLLMGRRFAIVNVTRSVSASSVVKPGSLGSRALMLIGIAASANDQFRLAQNREAYSSKNMARCTVVRGIPISRDGPCHLTNLWRPI